MAAPHIPFTTVEEYFKFDEGSESRNEYYRGYVMAMAGGTYEHAQIIGSIVYALRDALQDRPCDVLATELRLAADADAHYTYPDVMVVCGEPVFQSGRPHTLTNPILIVEVLSASTEASDRGRKFTDYRRLPSLREYMMVSQTEPRVEVFRPNQEGHWTLFESVGQESAVKLASIGVELSMAAIYRRVKFEPEPPVAE